VRAPVTRDHRFSERGGEFARRGLRRVITTLQRFPPQAGGPFACRWRSAIPRSDQPDTAAGARPNPAVGGSYGIPAGGTRPFVETIAARMCGIRWRGRAPD
jgi:hypothetical protein